MDATPTPRTGLDLISPALGSLIAAAGCIYTAATPTEEWSMHAPWVLGLIFLAPVEFARLIPLWLMQSALEKAPDPRDAARMFLRQMGLVSLFFVFSGGVGILVFLGLGAVIAFILVFLEGAYTLYYFHGNAGAESARLDALGDDFLDWLRLSLFAMPLTIGGIYLLLSWLANHGYALSTSIPAVRNDNADSDVLDFMPGLEILRQAAWFNIAIYFLGRGVVSAHTYSARFNSSGKRLLGARWIQRIVTGA